MKKIWAIVKAFEDCYGVPRLGNKTDPVDELVYIVVSARTREEVYIPVFDELKRSFPDWNWVTRENAGRLASLLRPAGLSAKKSEAILDVFDILRREHGTVTLDPVGGLADDLLETYLLGLPGIDKKTARCIMLFAFDRQVLPVDAHVFRVSKRLGLTQHNRADLAHTDLELAIPPNLRRAYHVGCVMHGRRVCRAKNPYCDDCIVAEYCGESPSPSRGD